MDELVILSPVYQPYRWLAPLLRAQLDRQWPDHPRQVFAGLTMAEAGGLPAIPVRDETLPRNWCRFMRDACETLRSEGVTRCFLIPEEHLPLAPCHAQHLNETLPRWMDEMRASYIGLMGWDRRRAVECGALVGEAYPGLRDLRAPRSPRFQLHPALWGLEALIACLDLILAGPNQSPWAFENQARKPDAALPSSVKDGGYLISGEAMSATPFALPHRVARRVGHRIARGFIGLVYLLPQRWRRPLWAAAQLDHFFYNGPFPMFFGGVMAKGKISRGLLRHLARDRADGAENAPLLFALRQRLVADQA